MLIGAGRRAVAVGVDDAATEQRVEKACRPRRLRGGAILRSAIVLRQRADKLPALLVLIGVVAALETLEIAHRAVEIVAHLLDLRIQRLAFRRLASEQRKKATALAAPSFRLRQQVIEIGLLFGDSVFAAPDLVGARGITAAAGEDRQLTFEADANGIGCR